MPSWGTHLVIASRINIIKKMSKDEFSFSNIMPDILEGYLIKNLSKHVRYSTTHFSKTMNINGIDIVMPDIAKFKKLYDKEMKNPIICGYYCHLITDYFWNYYTYKNHFKCIDKEENLIEVTLVNKNKKLLTWNEAVRLKQKDFTNFSLYLKENNYIYYPNYDKKIYESSSKIREIKLTEEDIKKTIEYIKDNIKNKKIEKIYKYKMLSKEELKKMFEACYEFVMEKLES